MVVVAVGMVMLGTVLVRLAAPRRVPVRVRAQVSRSR